MVDGGLATSALRPQPMHVLAEGVAKINEVTQQRAVTAEGTPREVRVSKREKTYDSVRNERV